MADSAPQPSAVLEAADLDALFDALRRAGYTTLGPTVRDGAVVFEALEGASDLPRGWRDHQDGARYRLAPGEPRAFFDATLGPGGPKRWLYPPERPLLTVTRGLDGLRFEPHEEEPPHYALIGVRPCELAALAIHDRVLSRAPYADPSYAARRGAAFVVAVSCRRPGGTCFCASVGTGPAARDGFDLALTELLDGADHRFAVTVGSARGAALVEALPTRPAGEAEREAVLAQAEAAAGAMGRKLDTDGLRELLLDNLEHKHWDEVARRCLCCGNCTLVCPTCFCTEVRDSAALDGSWARRERLWDSCFTNAFSYVHGGEVRRSPKSRYRQWLTHKLATWQDQFGVLGCVGCGRCITWCPVAIDLTAEVASLRARPSRAEGKGAAP